MEISKRKGLEYAIDHFKLYPITILQSLPYKDACRLFKKNVFLAEELCDGTLLKKLGFKNWKAITNEAAGVCHHFPSKHEPMNNIT